MIKLTYALWYPKWLLIHLNSIFCLPQNRAIWSQQFTEGKTKLKPYFMQWLLYSYDSTRAMDVMFDEEVLLALIAAEHNIINHKLDLFFVVVLFVTSSQKFYISSIWKIVYFVYRGIMVRWCTLKSIPLITIELSFAICSNNDMTHRSPFIVHPMKMFGYWIYEQWIVTQGQWPFECHFLRMSVTLLNMNRIKFSWCMPISNHISFVIFDIVFGTIHSDLSNIIIISIPQHLAYVFIMIDHDNVAINSILKFSTNRQWWQFWFVVRSNKRFHSISFDRFPLGNILWHLISTTRFAFINLLSFLTNKFTNVPWCVSIGLKR